MKNTSKLIKILAITNIITVIALFVLSYFLYINFRNHLVNVETNGDTGVKVTNLEMYLRKAGLVDVETTLTHTLSNRWKNFKNTTTKSSLMVNN